MFSYFSLFFFVFECFSMFFFISYFLFVVHCFSLFFIMFIYLSLFILIFIVKSFFDGLRGPLFRIKNRGGGREGGSGRNFSVSESSEHVQNSQNSEHVQDSDNTQNSVFLCLFFFLRAFRNFRVRRGGGGGSRTLPGVKKSTINCKQTTQSCSSSCCPRPSSAPHFSLFCCCSSFLYHP